MSLQLQKQSKSIKSTSTAKWPQKKTKYIKLKKVKLVFTNSVEGLQNVDKCTDARVDRR